MMNEPIIAYRVWQIKNGLLYAYAQDAAWKPMERFEADCLLQSSIYGYPYFGARKHLERAPISSCSCGIYAFKEVELVVEHMAENEKLFAGRVALWGSVIECERGYKAEFAYPQVLYYTSENEAQIRTIARRYAIDAVPLPESIMPAVLEQREKRKADPYGMYAMFQSYVTYVGSGSGGWTIVPPKKNPPKPSMIIIDDPVDKGLSASTARHPFKAFIAESRKRRHHRG